MRSRQLRLEQYDTDKIANRYLERYDQVFEPWVNREITLLELGVHKGGSLLLWRDYFPSATIVGIDIHLPESFQPGERILVFKGSQADVRFLSQVAKSVAPEGFDIIIDDASHIGELTRVAFWHLFDHHLKPGGIYVIEDWGTGYWDDWPDGKSLDLESYLLPPSGIRLLWSKIARRLGIKFPFPGHSFGMVGLVKQLVDEQAAHDVTRQSLSGEVKRQPRFESLLITPSIVFVAKSDANP